MKILVNTGSGSGLMPEGTKPLPEPMLTYHQLGPVAFIWGHYHKKIWRCPSVKRYWRLHFYPPVWKTDVLCRGNVRPSVRLSVRPSRPRFPDFSSTCFEILIWNLIYTFSRWHELSSLSCITIGSLWPSLQPKVGQTHFLQSWPHKSR